MKEITKNSRVKVWVWVRARVRVRVKKIIGVSLNVPCSSLPFLAVLVGPNY